MQMEYAAAAATAWLPLTLLYFLSSCIVKPSGGTYQFFSLLWLTRREKIWSNIDTVSLARLLGAVLLLCLILLFWWTFLHFWFFSFSLLKQRHWLFHLPSSSSHSVQAFHIFCQTMCIFAFLLLLSTSFFLCCVLWLLLGNFNCLLPARLVAQLRCCCCCCCRCRRSCFGSFAALNNSSSTAFGSSLWKLIWKQKLKQQQRWYPPTGADKTTDTLKRNYLSANTHSRDSVWWNQRRAAAATKTTIGKFIIWPLSLSLSLAGAIYAIWPSSIEGRCCCGSVYSISFSPHRSNHHHHHQLSVANYCYVNWPKEAATTALEHRESEQEKELGHLSLATSAAAATLNCIVTVTVLSVQVEWGDRISIDCTSHLIFSLPSFCSALLHALLTFNNLFHHTVPKWLRQF